MVTRNDVVRLIQQDWTPKDALHFIAQTGNNADFALFSTIGKWNHWDALASAQALAEEGDSIGQLYVGLVYAENRGPLHCMPRAVQWLKRAGTNGETRAIDELFVLAKMELLEAQALRDMARQGEGQAVYYWALYTLYHPEQGEEQEALAALSQCAKAGHCLCEMVAAVLRQWGKLPPHSDVVDHEVFANSGEEYVTKVVQDMLWLVTQVQPGDYKQPSELQCEDIHDIHRMAQAGNAEAQYAWGCYLRKQAICEQDRIEAYRWFIRAARQGHAKGAVKAAKLKYKTNGKLNHKSTSYWYGVAAFSYLVDALRGNGYAMYALANMCFKGRGMQENSDLGMAWLKQSARLSYGPALSKWGRCLWEGMGVLRSRSEALYTWHRLYQLTGQVPNALWQALWQISDTVEIEKLFAERGIDGTFYIRELQKRKRPADKQLYRSMNY